MRGKPTMWSPGIDWTHPQTNGLVLAYLFNEGAGPLAHDLGRWRKHGTLTNWTRPQDAWVGQGLVGDGSTTYVDVPTNLQGYGFNQPAHGSADGSGTIVTECIFTANGQGVFDSSANTSTNNGFAFFANSDLLVLRMGPTDLNVSVTYPFAGVFVASFDTAGTRVAQIWRNGQIIGSTTPSSLAATQINVRLLSLFNGTFEHGAEVKYVLAYNKKLPDQMIRQISLDPLAPFRMPTPVHLFQAGISVGGTTIPIFYHHYRRNTG